MPTLGVQHLEVVDGHLQDLRLLQLGGSLLLEGGGHEAPQLRQRVVDAVTAPLLDDTSAPLAGRSASAGGAVVTTEGRRQRRLGGSKEGGREGEQVSRVCLRQVCHDQDSGK